MSEYVRIESHSACAVKRNRRVTPVAHVNRKLYHLSEECWRWCAEERKREYNIPSHVVGDKRRRTEKIFKFRAN